MSLKNKIPTNQRETGLLYERDFDSEEFSESASDHNY